MTCGPKAVIDMSTSSETQYERQNRLLTLLSTKEDLEPATSQEKIVLVDCFTRMGKTARFE
jgi:hypothetical protein